MPLRNYSLTHFPFSGTADLMALSSIRINSRWRPLTSWIISYGHIWATAHDLLIQRASRGHLWDSTAFLFTWSLHIFAHTWLCVYNLRYVFCNYRRLIIWCNRRSATKQTSNSTAWRQIWYSARTQLLRIYYLFSLTFIDVVFRADCGLSTTCTRRRTDRQTNRRTGSSSR